VTLPSSLTPDLAAELPATVGDRRRLVVAGLVGFLLLGVVASVLGPALPEFRSRFHVDLSGGSVLLTVYSVGSVVGVLAGGWASHLRRPRPAMVAGTALVGAGSLAIAAAGTWWLVLAGGGLLGFGFGILDFGVSVIMASSFAESGASVLTSLSAVFSVGAVIGPIVVSATPHDVRPTFLAVAALSVVLVVLWTRTTVHSAPARPAAVGSRRALGRLALGFGFLLALYVAMESGVAAWETTYLRSAAHFADSSAARATSLFWVAITAGRLIGGWVARRVDVGVLVSTSIVLVAVSLVVAGLPGMGLVGFTAAGLFLAPVFPAAFAWFSATKPSALAMTLVFSSGVLGPAIVSPIIGAGTQAWGVAAIPFTLFVVALLDVTAVVTVRRRLSPA
jgi:MFS transporter, FHS family, glucose/mannose:H+ symporter